MLKPIKYPLDLTGKAASNFIQGEKRSLPRTRSRAFAPDHGTFYTKSVVLRHTATGTILTQGQDYRFLAMNDIVTNKSGQEAASIIHITNTKYADDFNYDYQAVGGEFSLSTAAIEGYLKILSLDNRKVFWDDILFKPVEFPAAPHMHDVKDWFGMESVVDALTQLKEAILTGNVQLTSQLQEHLARLQSAHDALQTRVNALERILQDHANRIAVLEGQ